MFLWYRSPRDFQNTELTVEWFSVSIVILFDTARLTRDGEIGNTFGSYPKEYGFESRSHNQLPLSKMALHEDLALATLVRFQQGHPFD